MVHLCFFLFDNANHPKDLWPGGQASSIIDLIQNEGLYIYIAIVLHRYNPEKVEKEGP